jgi:hypothetical protein
VGRNEGATVGGSVGAKKSNCSRTVGVSVGNRVGATDGFKVGTIDGADVGARIIDGTVSRPLSGAGEYGA